MINLEVIIDLLSGILLTLISVFLPLSLYNFKHENRRIRIKRRIKTSRNTIIGLYGTLLIMPICSIFIQLGAKDNVGISKNFLIFISFLIPFFFIIITSLKIWKEYQNNDYDLNKFFIFFLHFLILLFYSFCILSIIYLSYTIIFIGKTDGGNNLVQLYALLYFSLSFLYVIISRFLILSHKKYRATTVKINYNYLGSNVEKEVDFDDFEAKDSYITIDVEDDKLKYLIPWDKVNHVKVYYGNRYLKQIKKEL